MLAKLETSCLTADDAKLLGMKVVDAAAMGKLGLPPVPSFEIPYFNLAGKRTEFRRFRYLADTRTGFEALTKKKPTRYVQEKDTLQEAYFPPMLPKELGTWADLASNIEQSIIITEGELKAACATKYGFPTIGLGGVWSFRSGKRQTELLPELKKITWFKRKVVICFDSDADSNPDIIAARDALAFVLTAEGAKVHTGKMPCGPSGQKQGIDDFILANGPDEFAPIVEGADSYAASIELHRLNDEVVYIRNPGLVVRMENGQRMAPSDFTGHAYANRYYNVPNPEDETKFERKPIAKPWLTWPHRFELEKMEFTPGEPRFTDGGGYNTWPGWGVEPKKGDIAPWKALLDLLFGEDKAARQWFERWLAIPIQQPGAKMYTAAVLWGTTTGTGKSLVGYSMRRIYGTTFAEINETQLSDQRMAWAENKCFVMGDDVAGHEQRKVADRIKAMITQETMTIDVKYVPQFTVVDHVNYYFTSNHPDAFYIEDDDRRFFVHEVKCKRETKEFYIAYRAWLNGDGAAALMYHLKNLDIGEMTAQERAPATIAKEAMIEDGKGELGLWVKRLLNEPEQILKLDAVVRPGDLWASTDLVAVYDPTRSRITTTAMTRELKRAGMPLVYNGNQIDTRNGHLRLFAVRNRDKWLAAKPAEIAKHYNDTKTATPLAEVRHRKF
jgi:hypothetical protein